MALCNFCWICGDKFSCGALKQCSRTCVDACHDLYGRPLAYPAQVSGLEKAATICAECVRDVESGALQGLISALRASRASSTLDVNEPKLLDQE